MFLVFKILFIVTVIYFYNNAYIFQNVKQLSIQSLLMVVSIIYLHFIQHRWLQIELNIYPLLNYNHTLRYGCTHILKTFIIRKCKSLGVFGNSSVFTCERELAEVHTIFNHQIQSAALYSRVRKPELVPRGYRRVHTDK